MYAKDGSHRQARIHGIWLSPVRHRCEDDGRVASLGVTDHRAGAGGNYDWADLYCETAGYTFAFRHHRAVAWGTAMTRMTRKKQDSAQSGRLHPQRAEILWERPLGTRESPERPFHFTQGPARASTNAKQYPAVLQFISAIVVPTGPATSNSTYVRGRDRSRQKNSSSN